MKPVFDKRRERFINRCFKYLRYVFNDHFVLVLMVFLGFLLLQYRQLLQDFPKNPWYVVLLLAGLSLVLLFSGRTATYLEVADQHFLLNKEKEVGRLIKKASLRTFLIWGSLQTLLQIFLAPLYVKLGLSKIAFLVYLLLLLVVKYCWHVYQDQKKLEGARLNWDLAIHYEQQRQQSILQFFALFTTVKGITSSVKRRSYLDGFLDFVKKEHRQTWDYLYLRAFLRSGDFFALTLRLTILSLVFLVAIKESWLAIGLAFLFDYLLVFQLLALYSIYDYQYLVQLYPLTLQKKRQSFLRILRKIAYAVLLVQVLLAVLVLPEKLYALVLAGLGVVLNQIYLAYKSKKLID